MRLAAVCFCAYYEFVFALVFAWCCFVALCSFDSKRNKQEDAVDFALLSFDPACFLFSLLCLSLLSDRRSSAVFSLQIKLQNLRSYLVGLYHRVKLICVFVSTPLIGNAIVYIVLVSCIQQPAVHMTQTRQIRSCFL